MTGHNGCKDMGFSQCVFFDGLQEMSHLYMFYHKKSIDIVFVLCDFFDDL